MDCIINTLRPPTPLSAWAPAPPTRHTRACPHLDEAECKVVNPGLHPKLQVQPVLVRDGRQCGALAAHVEVAARLHDAAIHNLHLGQGQVAGAGEGQVAGAGEGQVAGAGEGQVAGAGEGQGAGAGEGQGVGAGEGQGARVSEA